MTEIKKRNYFIPALCAALLLSFAGPGVYAEDTEPVVSTESYVNSSTETAINPAANGEALSDADTVTIYTTNDIHGVVAENKTDDVESSSIGMAQAAAIKASTENALLVDAGDATQGVSFATVTQGADVIKVMNAAGYDAMAAGNHEFDYGAEQLLENQKLAKDYFPILSANVLKENGDPLLTPSTVIEAGGHNIGFIGLTTRATATSTNPSKLAGITFGDEVEAAKKQIADLKDKTDAIVLICHMGNDDKAVSCTSQKLLEQLDNDTRKEISAVIDGHSHTIETGDKEFLYEGIPIIQTGTNFTHLGVITLTFKDGETVSADGSVMDYDKAMGYELTADGEAAAKQVDDLLSSIEEDQKKILSEELCENASPLWGGYIYYDYVESRIVETIYGDFVTDAFASYAKTFAEKNGLNLPVIAVENGGGISSTLPAGKVLRKDILDAFNHGNMVDVLKVTPAQLYAAIESGLVTTGQDDTGLLLRERVSGSFLQVSGFSYTYDPAGESGAKVTDITLDNGTELKRDDTSTLLLLATNNYVTSNAFMDSEKAGELGGEDQLVEEYLREQTDDFSKVLPFRVTKNRIRIANDHSPDFYEVSIPIRDSKGNPVSLTGNVAHLRIDDGKYETYTVNGDGNLLLSLPKGPHTLFLEESTNGQPVYVNNYSGSGTVTTKDGYYCLRFTVDPAAPETHNHSYSGWKSDSNSHWQECTCGARTNEGAHTYKNGYCTVCGAAAPVSATAEKNSDKKSSDKNASDSSEDKSKKNTSEEKAESVKTGDENPIFLWSMLMLLSLSTIAALEFTKRKASW